MKFIHIYEGNSFPQEAQYVTPDVVTCAPQYGQKLDGLVVRFSIATGAGERIGCVTFCLFLPLTIVIIPNTIIAVITRAAWSVCIAGSSLPKSRAAIGNPIRISPRT
ncbi:MAG: hypothetical protein RTV72_10790 [Candidatus Thorarchaeota archaeon]